MSGLETETALIFLVDTSGSMFGQTIQAVNAAAAECLEVLREGQTGSLEIGYVTFHEQMSQIVLKQDMTAPVFQVLPNPSGFYAMTSFACLYKGICQLLADHSWKRLYLILVTDGKPVDRGEYTEFLERAKSLEPFRKAERYVAQVGNETNLVNSDILAFVGLQADRIVPLARLSSLMSRIREEISGGGQSGTPYDRIFGK